MERERGEWLTAQLYRLQLEGPDSLQQHLDFWETSMTEGRERKGNEADEYNRAGKVLLPAVCLGPLEASPLEGVLTGLWACKASSTEPKPPSTLPPAFPTALFFFFLKTLPTTAPHPECSPKTRSETDTKNLSYSATVWKTRVSITFTKVNKCITLKATAEAHSSQTQWKSG